MAPGGTCRAEELVADWPTETAAQLVDAPKGTRVWLPTWRSIPTVLDVSLQDEPGRGAWIRFIDERGMTWMLRPGVELRALRPDRSGGAR